MTRPLKRFFINTLLAPDKSKAASLTTVHLTREETHHIKNVLRMREGSVCLLFDRAGNEFLSRLEKYLPNNRCEAILLESFQKTSSENKSEKGLRLTVAQAIPQHRKMDLIVEKAAELGILGVIPLVTERTMARLAKDREEKVCARWNRIAAQTLEQSKVEVIPEISSMVSFSKLCEHFGRFDRVFIFHLNQKAELIQEALKKTKLRKSDCERILLLIGPEGGFTDHEVHRAKNFGAELVRMSSGVLKTDTAFVAAISIVQATWE
jgi:16S rRNA (uracil1498-N3)-methyltransferase